MTMTETCTSPRLSISLFSAELPTKLVAEPNYTVHTIVPSSPKMQAENCDRELLIPKFHRE